VFPAKSIATNFTKGEIVKNRPQALFKMLMALVIITVMGSFAEAAPTLVSGGLGSLGEIERITLNNPADVYSGGVMVVGGGEMIIPKNLLIDLPANRLSLQQIFDQAPAACKALGESGLAKADKCNGSGTGAIATLHAVRTNAGNVIIGDLFIQKAAELVVGVVTYINYTEGYYRVNGLPNDPNTGAMVRLNDPTSRHTIQRGAGCTTSGPGYPNCSPDPRFTLDPDNYTNTFATGYPVCIPSTVSRNFTNPLGGPTSSQATANGTGDYLCPDTNRSPLLTEPPVADSRRFAPVKVGDSVTAEGNYETVNGVRFLSAHTSTVQKALATSNALGQPDYLFLEEVDIEAPAFQNERQIAMFIGFTTFAPTDVDIWSLHRDPVNNESHEFPLASVQGCDVVQGGPGNCSAQGIANGPANTNIFKIIYRDDYQKNYDPKLSPCAHLLASPRFRNTGVCAGGGSIANDFAVLSPIPHEIIARTGRKIDSATNPAIGNLITIDINGNLATNGEYLFPLGLNLGGIGVAEMSEIDLNLTNSPTIFDGIPWTLDRRLGPSGCLNGGCESLATSPIGTRSFALDPFPFSGLDPRTQASGLPTGSYSNPTFSPGTLTNIKNRIFSYVTGAGIFNGNATLLPCATGVFPANCPADPPLIAINPTPALNIFSPFADEDAAVVSTGPGASVVIDVLANDVAILGNIDPASLLIVSSPASGTVQLNPNHTITFFPSNPFTVGSVTFTYTVANNFGAVSLPGTVTVTILNTFTIASAAAPNGSITPAGPTSVLSNTNQTYTITPNAGFTVANLVVDGTVLPGATSYTFTDVTADHYINAYFANQTFTVTAAAGANGTITPAGAAAANYGAASSFAITPAAGFQIENLVVDGVTLPAVSSYTFTNITGDHTISANFAPAAALTITATAAPNGTISPEGTSSAQPGASQTFAITPNAGFQIANLVVDGVTLPAASSYTFTSITGNHTISAAFSNNFTLTASAGPNGSISPAGAATVTGGTNQTYTITPNAGYVVASLVVDGVTLPGAASYAFTNIAANHSISASFALPPTISAAAGPNGSISPAGTTSPTYGGSQSYTVTPNAGFIVTNLVVDGVTLPGSATYTFTNVTSDHYINAYFSPLPASVNISAAAGPDGTISPAGATAVAGGADQTYTITPDNGFMVTNLVADGIMLPGATSYTFTNVTTDHYLNAYFGPIPATVTIAAAAGANGSISPAGATLVSGGNNQTYTITPDAGFTVTNLVVDGILLPGATAYTFTNVTGDHYINAYFGP